MMTGVYLGVIGLSIGKRPMFNVNNLTVKTISYRYMYVLNMASISKWEKIYSLFLVIIP